MNIEERVKQFEKFYHFLMKESPRGYIPWFFPCDKKGKNPSTSAILKINPLSKGSWHHESARLNKEQCIEHLREGYNIGISARTGDPLIIGDIDEAKYMNQMPKDTLTTTSRKRCGGHFFGWDKDGSAKINLPTDCGEIRSSNQYVISPGSYVPFHLENEKEKRAFDNLTKEAQKDKLLGYYTIKESVIPREISFNELPKFFIEKEMENIESEAKIKNRNEEKSFKQEGKYTELFNLKVSDIVGLIPANKRQGHPLHESDTDANFSLSKDGALGMCWRHLVSLNAVQYLCVKAGYKSCVDAGTPHKGRGISKIKGDKKSYEVAYQEALKLGLISEYKGKSYEKEDSENQQTTIFRQLAKDFYERQPYFYDSAKLWWLWNKNEFFWEVKDEIDIMNQFDKYFNQESEKSNIKSGIIEALKKYGRKHKPKEIKPTWIQFKKQIYDIENDNSFEATPEYFIANPIPWEVGDSEETPNIDKLFSSWVKEKDIPKLYELFSFPLIPEMFIHSFHFLYSAPGMGKSTYLNLLIKFIGRKNVVSTSINRINSNPRFETYNWNKKLLITLGEVSNINDLKNSGLINQATGGEPIRAEVKGGGGFDFVNYGKFIYPTNKLLKVDSDDGFGRRVRIIKFQTRFEKEKDILNSIPEEEFSNLSKKCLRIVKELYKKRRFTGDVSISERMNNYQEESKTILERFIDTFCDTTNFEGKILLDEFFSKYNSHLQINKETRVNKSVLAKELNKLGWETKRELVVSEQQSLGSFAKKELKSFVLGISKISPITPITPYFPLLPLRGSSEILPVIPVMPDISKEINTISKKEMLDFYKKQGLEEETKEILEESKW